jgi:O-antigen/teichoic acid export membrane protein
MGLRAAAARGAFWNVAVNFGSQAVTFLVFLVLARLLPPGDIGVVAAANAILGFLWILVDQGISTSIVRMPTTSTRTLNTAFWLIAATTGIATLLVMVAAPAIARLYGSPMLAGVLRALICGTAMSALGSVPAAILLRDLRFAAHAGRRLVAVVIGGIVGLIMAFGGYGVWSLVGKQLTEAVVDLGLLWAVTRWLPGVTTSRQEAAPILRFGVRIAGSNLASFAIRRADEFFVGMYLGSIQLGIYAVAMRAVVLLNEVCVSAIYKTAVPILSRIQDDREKLGRACQEGVQLTSAVVFPLFAGLALTAPEAIVTLFGDRWIVSVRAMQLLSLAALPATVALMCDPLMIATERANWVFRLTLLRSAVTLVALLAALPFGIEAIAGVSIVRAVLYLPVSAYVIRRLTGLGIGPLLWTTFGPTGGIIVMAIVVSATRRFVTHDWSAPPMLVLHVLVGAVAYCSSLLLLDAPLARRLWSVARNRF